MITRHGYPRSLIATQCTRRAGQGSTKLRITTPNAPRALMQTGAAPILERPFAASVAASIADSADAPRSSAAV